MAYGCRPLTARIIAEYGVPSFEEFRQGSRREIEARTGRSLSDEEAAEAFLTGLTELESSRAPDPLDSSEIESAVVIVGDEVGHYFASLQGTNLTDVMSVLAPPFERFFVEFDRIPNSPGLASWGVLFIEENPQYDEEGWLLRTVLVGEWRRCKPIGPIATGIVPLDRDGLLFAGDEHRFGSIFARTPEIEGVPEEVAVEFMNDYVGLLGPALFTVSFLHCKNVDIRPVDPTPKLSRKAERQHGRPLTQYYVLDIKPMRRILDSEGEAQTKGLRHALHICRGHFKTYTDESPLFGKRTGTYWRPTCGEAPTREPSRRTTEYGSTGKHPVSRTGGPTKR
jgi:hypothetical protein